MRRNRCGLEGCPDRTRGSAHWGGAVADGSLSTDAVDSIRAGLGVPNEAVSAESLAGAATQLAEQAVCLDADRVFALARQLRDELDAAGIVDRERAARAAREFRLQRLR